MTSAQVLSKHSDSSPEQIEDTERIMFGQDEILPAMIEFAKMKVKEALEAAGKVKLKEKKVVNKLTSTYFIKKTIDKESILNAYDLNSII